MTISIIIPTYNRARILDDCLARLPLFDCEVVVSDNASPDDTAGVVSKHMKYDRRIRYFCAAETTDAFANLRRAGRLATGDVLVYLADDDSLLSEPLAAVCGLFERDPSLVACYCDHICWDDAQGIELHRYGFPAQAVESQGDPTGLVQYLLTSKIPPEIGVFRREAFLKAELPYARAMSFHAVCYNYGRLGKVRFDPTCFYRENWVLKPGLARTFWNNQDWAAKYIGDEQRLGLEIMLRQAEVHSGLSWDKAGARDMIDAFLFDRTNLEIKRACDRSDYILARELRCRQQLWRWNAPIQFDQDLTKKAAAQAARLLGHEDSEMLLEAYRI